MAASAQTLYMSGFIWRPSFLGVLPSILTMAMQQPAPAGCVISPMLLASPRSIIAVRLFVLVWLLSQRVG